jgi:hypothetical protein
VDVCDPSDPCPHCNWLKQAYERAGAVWMIMKIMMIMITLSRSAVKNNTQVVFQVGREMVVEVKTHIIHKLKLKSASK